MTNSPSTNGSLLNLPPIEARQTLLQDLNYINLGELKSFCKRYAIPYRIAFQKPDGSPGLTDDDDRKGVILNRVGHLLETSETLPQTSYPASVVLTEQLSGKKPLPDIR